MVKRLGISVTFVLALGAVIRAEHIKANLSGYQEVPSVATVASGEFRATISNDDQAIDYELTYSGLQGTVQQSHIHIAQPGVNGSIVIWLCQTSTTPAPVAVRTQTPFCPSGGGTVTGHITASEILAGGTASQQLPANNIDIVIKAIRAGVAYANVHTTPLSPGGEIRGQIQASARH